MEFSQLYIDFQRAFEMFIQSVAIQYGQLYASNQAFWHLILKIICVFIECCTK